VSTGAGVDRTDFAGPRRFNHVAMSIAPDLLDEKGRGDLCAFYGDVLGWAELPTMTADRERLVLSVHSFDQFVFIVGDDDPLRAPESDHFGLAVESLVELETVLDRARTWRERDDRVEIVDYSVEDHEVLKLHSFYLRFLLPLMVEIQWFEWTPAPQESSDRS
jgi:hypothetical protein